MLKRVLDRIRKEYHFRVLHEDAMEYKISQMRDAGYLIGDHCKIYSSLGTPEPYLIEIGNDVTISFDVTVITHDNAPIKVVDGATDIVGKIVIGNNCFIGAGAIILPGVTLAEKTIIAAGSVVTKSVHESQRIVAGNPAKEIGTWDDYKRKIENKCFNFDGMSYERKKEEILANMDKHVHRQ